MNEIKKAISAKKHDDDLEYEEVPMEKLWDNAYAAAKGSLKFDPEKQEELADFRGARGPIAQTEVIFHKWRRPEEAGTLAEQERERKVRDRVKNCLYWAQQACSYTQSHASGTYAQPVEILAGGMVYLFNAANEVSQDLDAIDSTFELISKAMESANSLERHSFVTLSAKKALVGLFIAILQFCSYVGSDIRAQSRLKMWRNKIFKLNYDDIESECAKIEGAIADFQAAIHIENANDTKEVREGMNWLIKNTNTKMQQSILLSSVSSLTKKGNVLDKLAQALQHNLNLNLNLMSHMATRMDTTLSRLVPRIFGWLQAELSYKQWLEQPSKGQFLHITGDDGVGKTFLTAHCYMLIQNTAEQNYSLVEKHSVRQQLVMTYFLFEPGFRHFQNVPGVIASILFQIASQDPKWCDSISTKPELHSRDPSRIWRELILKRFDKRSHSSEKLYILLDGLTDMQSKERESLLKLFSETLNGGHYRIWILFTWTGQMDGMQPPNAQAQPPLTIGMSMDKCPNAVKQIFDARKKNYENLKSIHPAQEKYAAMCEYLEISSKGNLSSLDQKLEILDETLPDRKKFWDIIKKRETDDIDLFSNEFSGQNETMKRAITRLLWWCAFAKQNITVYELERLLRLNRGLTSLGIDEVLRRCRILLDTQQILLPNQSTKAVDSNLYWCSQPDYPMEQRLTDRSIPDANDCRYAVFRQASFVQHIQNGRGMFKDVSVAKLRIFVTLCEILCDASVSKVDSVHEYAAIYVISHLRDIEIEVEERESASKTPKDKSKRDILSTNIHPKDATEKDKQMKPKRSRISDADLEQVARALYKLLSNETGASSVFERIQSQMSGSEIYFDLYDLPDDTGLRHELNEAEARMPKTTVNLISDWAREICTRNEEKDKHLSLSPQILEWAKGLAEQPQTMLLSLAQGHLSSWAQKTTIEEARIPYKLAYRAFCTSPHFPHWSREQDEINTKIAEDMIGRCRESRTIFAQARLAAALLLHESPDRADRDYAVFLHEKNRVLDESMYAERLYSMLSLAEHYSPDACSHPEGSDWELVKTYTKEALDCLEASDPILRPNLNPKKCMLVYKLHVKACKELGDTERARRTCAKALSNPFLKGCPGMGYFLTVLVEIFTAAKDYSSVIQAITVQIKNQSYLIPAWLMNRCRYISNDDRLRRAAAATGNTDLLIQVYDGAICYWANKGLFHETCVMLYELAVIYRRDCQALKMAEDILNRILDTVKHDESLQVDSTLLSMIVSERFDIYFERLSKSWIKSSKESLCKVAANLIDHPRVADVIESSIRACSLITLAKMYSEIGHKHDANECADHAFRICIADLEDWVDDNDMPAFRALAKVLHFGGLQKDAGIAASLVFNKAKADAPGVTDEEYFDTLSSTINPENRPGSISAITCHSETRDLMASPGSGAVSPVSGLLAEDETLSQISQDSLHDSAGLGQSPVVSEASPVTSPNDGIADVDAGNGCVLQCMGHCENQSLKEWPIDSEPWYFCLDCPNVDYCKECYDNLNVRCLPQGLGECPKLCWGKHTSLQLPIPGWKGVQGGLIRVDSSSRGVREWLTDMKERWTSEMERKSKNQKNRKKRT